MKNSGEGVLTDVSEACMRMRMVKSDEEIAVIRQSARAADMAGFAIRDAMKEGVMEYELTQIGVQVSKTALKLTDPCNIFD